MKQWEKRVVAFEIIYSMVMREKFSKDILNQIDNLENDCLKIVNYAIDNFLKIKEKIESNLKSNWSWTRILEIDKAILIEAYAEFFSLKIDKKIIIDQAIITAKNYSDANSYKFINYVLDKILNENI